MISSSGSVPAWTRLRDMMKKWIFFHRRSPYWIWPLITMPAISSMKCHRQQGLFSYSCFSHNRYLIDSIAIWTIWRMWTLVSIERCAQWIQRLSGKPFHVWIHDPLMEFWSRVMLAWLFLEDFWTPDRVKSYLSKVPPVSLIRSKRTLTHSWCVHLT